MVEKRIEFPCQDITLEGVLTLPDGEGPFALLVVCHPHPLYGGSMANKVVHSICEKAGGLGLACFKFNFRGVGRSEGEFADGIGEKEDAKAAISYGQTQGKINLEKIGICGYSFGSTIAFSVAVEDQRVKAVAGISPLIQPPDLLHQCPKPKLFLCGGNDDFMNAESLKKLVPEIPEPKELVIYPGVDHFWIGYEDTVAERVNQFFTKYLI